MDTTSPIITVECKEPKEIVLHNIYPMSLTPENMKVFWEKSKVHPTLFYEEVRGDWKKFVEIFIDEYNGVYEPRGLFWVVDDFVGVFYITRIQTCHDALVHMTFFDGRLKGRQPLAFELMKFIFRKYQFRRLSMELPDYVRPFTVDFAKSLGFKLEGKKRRASFFSNKYFDTNLYGILREEVLNGSEN